MCACRRLGELGMLGDERVLHLGRYVSLGTGEKSREAAKIAASLRDTTGCTETAPDYQNHTSSRAQHSCSEVDLLGFRTIPAVLTLAAAAGRDG